MNDLQFVVIFILLMNIYRKQCDDSSFKEFFIPVFLAPLCLGLSMFLK